MRLSSASSFKILREPVPCGSRDLETSVMVAAAPAGHLVSGSADQTRSATKGVTGVLRARRIGCGQSVTQAATRCMPLQVRYGMGACSRGVRPAAVSR
jgi:hypothetical protein